ASPASSAVSQVVNTQTTTYEAATRLEFSRVLFPSFTVSYSGFVLGESNSALGGSLAFATSAITSSPVGSYSITPSGLTSANYTRSEERRAGNEYKASSTTALPSSINPSA